MGNIKKRFIPLLTLFFLFLSGFLSMTNQAYAVCGSWAANLCLDNVTGQIISGTTRCQAGLPPNQNAGNICCTNASECPTVIPAPPAPPQVPNKSATQELMENISGEDGLNIDPQMTIGDILSKLIPYLYVFGGLVLFIMIVWGGFEMLTGAADTKAQEAGQQRITAAAIGFVLLFISYWLVQVLQVIFKFRVL